MTKQQECDAAIAEIQKDIARYPVGSIQRAQLQARIDTLTVEKNR